MVAGGVEEVLSLVEHSWARQADPSLVRYFIFSVLTAAAPPYSSYFAASILRCASRENALIPFT